MEHIEFLEKTAAAKKHQKEYVIMSTKKYSRLALIGAFGQFASVLLVIFPIISTLFVLLLIFSSALLMIGSVFFIALEAEKSNKDFYLDFPEEARLITLVDKYNKS